MKVQALNNPPVVGFLHEPDRNTIGGLVVTHGAGANCGSALLVNIATHLASLGWAVLRCDLPFRQKRKLGPPSPAQAPADQDGLRAALRDMRSRIGAEVYLGGHSYGGRQASIVAAEDGSDVPGLFLLSYPLHPPAKPAQLRTAHFKNIQTSCLFVHGTSDPFGSPDEMRTAIGLIPAQTQLISLDGLGHDLGKGKMEVGSRIAEDFDRVFSPRARATPEYPPD
ncbi:MAG: alpha/beta family hydrolase [Bryobacteraceae bacterium]